MIIIKVQGGLGNQLFQYSFGRLLEIEYKKEVAYDLSFYNTVNKYTVRKFLLDKFNTKMRIATDEEIKQTKYPYGIFSKIIIICKKALNKFVFKKYQVAYDTQLLPSLEKKSNVYLEGFWQSYVYYNSIIEELRKEITIKENPNEQMNEYIKKINSDNSVSVHIRHGDYLSSGKDLQALPKDYYEKSVNYLESKIIQPKYYIFSDDITWVENSMGNIFQNAVYIKQGMFEDYEEIILMSLCKNNIIANSSFSWWGAMLNITKNNVVITPKDWKNIHFKGNDNLCPKDWIRI